MGSYAGVSSYPLNDFFIWKYWLKDPDHAQPVSSGAFSTTGASAKLIAYMPPKADPTTGGLSKYGQLFFESSTANTSKSMTTECTVTVEQKLFEDDDV